MKWFKAAVCFLIFILFFETLIYINCYGIKWQMRGYEMLPTAAPAPIETPSFNNN